MALQFGHKYFDGLTLEDERMGQDIRRIIEKSRALVAERTVYDGFTIDPYGALDLDDGFSVEVLEDGFRIGVHIPNTGALIRPGNEVYDLVLENGVTEYFGNQRPKPMLPWKLSEDALSLLPGEPRPTIATFFTYDREFELAGRDAQLAAFQNINQFSYSEADRAFFTPGSDFQSSLAILLRSALTLYKKRQVIWRLPHIDLQQTTLPIYSEEGYKIRVPDEETIASFIVQEHMIATGRFFRSLCPENQVLSRNHRGAINETVQGMMSELQIDLDAPDARDRLRRMGFLLAGFRGRNLPRATYGATNEGHYGLGLPEYAHATSPLRRGADHTIHVVLDGILSQDPVDVDPESLDLAGQIFTQKSHAAKDRQKDLLTTELVSIEGGELNPISVDWRRYTPRQFGIFVKLSLSTDREIEGLESRVGEAVSNWSDGKSLPTPMLLGSLIFEGGVHHRRLGNACARILDDLVDPDWKYSNSFAGLVKKYFQETGRVRPTDFKSLKNGVFQATICVEKNGELLFAAGVDTKMQGAERRAWKRLALIQNERGDLMPENSTLAQELLDKPITAKQQKKREKQNAAPKPKGYFRGGSFKKITQQLISSPSDEERASVIELFNSPDRIQNPKTLLTEIVKKVGQNPIRYEISRSSEGDFLVCEIGFSTYNSEPITVRGKGETRERAERSAAIQAVEHLAIKTQPRQDVHKLILASCV